MNGDESAFPRLEDLRTTGKRYCAEYSAAGLTKRELFAAMAMQGELAAARDFKPAPEYVAEIGVRCADALLAALERPADPHPAVHNGVEGA